MISHLAVYQPSVVVTNELLATLYPDWTAEKILEKTGIRERRVVQEGECASDLAYSAARKLPRTELDGVDYLLLCTQTPDYVLPTTACVLQHRLGLPTNCAALDFNLGCSGYVYGLSLANSLLQSGTASKVLLLTADTYSRLIHPADKSVRTIFGDAGTATLLGKESPHKLHSFVLGSDGSGADQLMLKVGGARYPHATQAPTVDNSGNVRDERCLFMNGPEIFNFTLKAVPKLVAGVLSKSGLTLSDVDLVIFHQANAFMLEHLRKKLSIEPKKFVVHLEHCGNTVSSTIPLALSATAADGRLRPGMKVLLAGFGVGYSWGGCILEWH